MGNPCSGVHKTARKYPESQRLEIFPVSHLAKTLRRPMIRAALSRFGRQGCVCTPLVGVILQKLKYLNPSARRTAGSSSERMAEELLR
jgi:hypothetical protein